PVLSRPGPGRLLLLGGRALTISNPTADDFGKLARECGWRPGRRPPTAEKLTALLHTPRGCRFLVWLLARRHQPQLRLSDLKPLIGEADVIGVLAALHTAEQTATLTGRASA